MPCHKWTFTLLCVQIKLETRLDMMYTRRWNSTKGNILELFIASNLKRETKFIQFELTFSFFFKYRQIISLPQILNYLRKFFVDDLKYLKRIFAIISRQDMKEVCTHELNVGPVILDPSNSNDGNSYFSIRYPDTVSPAYCAIYEKKSHLVMQMLERRIGRELMLQVTQIYSFYFIFFYLFINCLLSIYKLPFVYL